MTSPKTIKKVWESVYRYPHRQTLDSITAPVWNAITGPESNRYFLDVQFMDYELDHPIDEYLQEYDFENT